MMERYGLGDWWMEDEDSEVVHLRVSLEDDCKMCGSFLRPAKVLSRGRSRVGFW